MAAGVEFRTLVRSARATRWFDERPVERHAVEWLVDVARLTGSARNRQPWTFVAVYDFNTKRTLAAFGNYATHLAQAPVVVVVGSNHQVGGLDRLFDVGRACQTLMLAAAATGLGSCPATFFPEPRQQSAAAAVGLAAPWVASHAIALGWPAPEPASNATSAVPRGRRPLRDVLVHFEPEPSPRLGAVEP